METFRCQIEWLGGTYDTQIVTNEGEYPLLGTMLLSGKCLTIDYISRNVSIR